MSNQWKNGLFGCFADPKLCIITFLAPCFTLGKNAEQMGDDCMLIGLLSCLGVPGFGPILRWRIRQEKGIEGTMMMDALLWFVCPCCALIQEANELAGPKAPETSNQAMARE